MSEQRSLLTPWLNAAIAFWLLLLSGATNADPQSQSFSTWKQVGDHITMRFTIAAREVTRLAQRDPQSDLPELLLDHLNAHIGVSAAGTPCTVSTAAGIKASRTGYLVAEMQFECPPASASVTIHNHAFLDLVSSHVHFAKFATGKANNFEQLFTSQQRSGEFILRGQQRVGALAENNAATVRAYITLGFQHILEGLDHIAFLICLIILSARLRDILLIVTGFTIGHSITLSLAVLGIAKPDIGVVEAMIGFTIALVAAENIAVRSHANQRIAIYAGAVLGLLAVFGLVADAGPSWLSIAGLALFSFCYLRLSNSEQTASKLRPLITALFGLVHGFGFANVLLEVGLPDNRVAPALFGFNVGVELGQIAIVLTLWVAGVLFFKLFRQSNRRLYTDLASATLCCVGVFWFVQRGYLL